MPKLQLYHSMDLLSFSFFSSFKYFLYLLLASQVFAQKPYREQEFGTSSLRLLSALHPLTSMHPVIHYNVGQLWGKVIPQMLQILHGKGLVRMGRNQAGQWEDSKRDGVPWCRMELFGVRRTGASLSVPLRCYWMGLLLGAVF